ncbi:MAG: T9SS type A sorting domain-containing protein [Chitinophagales bacterium]|nr:T9SS type A sorting domain-containing protein [Chitinophagales bacterium]MCZ2393296.1 T9SS type A sorting domain-containing protein [Chitinophagales bacterium]
MRKHWIILLILTVNLYVTQAQEKLVSLSNNPLLFSKTSTLKKSSLDTLSLPFADDFNQIGYYPNTSKWQDNFVFINNTYPIQPPTLGVATFDGLNAQGLPYSDYNNDFGLADQLTSLPINLSSLNESDNVYLSFYWQAGGRGEIPEKGRDYLNVEFLDKDLNWVTVIKINPTDSVQDFKQEFIRLNSINLHNNFQFRFSAYGNLAGNTDHWNIDYVLLDKNRNPQFESSVSDVAYVSANSGYLKTYYQMPFKHFNNDLLKDTLQVTIKNNFQNTIDIVDNYTVTHKNNGEILHSYKGPSIDIPSKQLLVYHYPSLDLSTIEPTSDTTEIEIKYFFQSSAENNSPEFVRANNQITEKITFGNIFAYDDASAERAYRLENYEYAKVAVKFNASIADTLRALRIHFPHFPNYSPTSAVPSFNIVIYKSLDTILGENDQILYKESFVTHENFHLPQDENINGFSYYTLNPDLNEGKDYLIVDGDFYIGIEYEKSNDVDLGFDMNQNNSNNMWYNAGYGWHKSQYPGSIMINAIMGKPLGGKYTSIYQHQPVNIPIQVYPNPAKDYLNIRIDYPYPYTYIIYNIAGIKHQSGRSFQNAPLPISDLPNGMYILQMLEESSKKRIAQTKFVKD